EIMLKLDLQASSLKACHLIKFRTRGNETLQFFAKWQSSLAMISTTCCCRPLWTFWILTLTPMERQPPPQNLTPLRAVIQRLKRKQDSLATVIANVEPLLCVFERRVQQEDDEALRSKYHTYFLRRDLNICRKSPQQYIPFINHEAKANVREKAAAIASTYSQFVTLSELMKEEIWRRLLAAADAHSAATGQEIPHPRGVFTEYA
ncbi:hypothetical protein C8J57DRAFT_1320913, partial [Mycena rebaudengoi]